MTLPKRTTADTITVRYIAKVTSPELDFEMYGDIFGVEESNRLTDEGWIQEVYLPMPRYTNPAIKISEVRKFLDELESKGCNYVTIDANTDHPDYTFEGYDVHQATQGDLDEYNVIDKAERMAEKNRLLKMIEEINKEIKKLDE